MFELSVRNVPINPLTVAPCLASRGDVDHGFRHVEAGFVDSYEPAPTCHPSEGAFHDPPPGAILGGGRGAIGGGLMATIGSLAYAA
jgi:hypothetical protein